MRERVFYTTSPKTRNPCQFSSWQGFIFTYVVFRRGNLLLAVFGNQLIYIRITQFFRFLKVTASFICLLQLYLTKSQ